MYVYMSMSGSLFSSSLFVALQTKTFRKQMDEEFGELAETEQEADQVFIAETEHQDFKIDLPQKLKDDAAQFCYGRYKTLNFSSSISC